MNKLQIPAGYKAPVVKKPRDRRTFVGGSDVAAVLALSPWKTPLELYLEKIAAEPLPQGDKPVFQRGKRWEAVVLEMLMEKLEQSGIVAQIIGVNRVYTDAECPFMQCELDAELIIDGKVYNVEIKTVSPFAAGDWGEAESDEIPIHYQAQAMQGLGITGRDTCIVAALFGADNIVVYYIDRDQETIAGIRDKIKQFWIDNVLARVAPEPVRLSDILKIFGRVNGLPVEANDEVYQAVSGLRHVREQIKRLEDDEDELQMTIAGHIMNEWKKYMPGPMSKTDNAVLTYNGRPILTWRRERGTYLDQQTLKLEQPDTVERLTVEYWKRPMRIKKPRKEIGK